jgi:putative Holliday junction resolvase
MGVMKILAIDYGTVRVGTALSFGTLAEPEKVLANDEGLMREVLKLVTENGVGKVVVGVSENEMAKKSAEWAAALRQELQTAEGVPQGVVVELADETLSSYEVEDFLKRQKGAGRRKAIDHLAAAVILQNYIDSQPREEGRAREK